MLRNILSTTLMSTRGIIKMISRFQSKSRIFIPPLKICVKWYPFSRPWKYSRSIWSIFQENWYTAPQLSIIIYDKYNILLDITCKNNHIVWTKNKINLAKEEDWGNPKVIYDWVNRVLCPKWSGKTVVNLVSTLGVLGLGNNLRQKRYDILDIDSE